MFVCAYMPVFLPVMVDVTDGSCLVVVSIARCDRFTGPQRTGLGASDDFEGDGVRGSTPMGVTAPRRRSGKGQGVMMDVWPNQVRTGAQQKYRRPPACRRSVCVYWLALLRAFLPLRTPKST